MGLVVMACVVIVKSAGEEPVNGKVWLLRRGRRSASAGEGLRKVEEAHLGTLL